MIKATTAPICEYEHAGPCGIVIFGASGDLSSRKLLPSLYELFRKRRVPDNFFVTGVARSKMTRQSFRDLVASSILNDSSAESDTSRISEFQDRCYYLSGQYSAESTYSELADLISELGDKFNTGKNIIFNLATPPTLYGTIVAKLSGGGLIRKGQNENPFNRVVIEKPFGRNLESATVLNQELTSYLDEDQIYRIDHYLGKETVQNIVAFRFANLIFENVWNRNFIDHVQITVAEELGVGHRAGYFDNSGLVRDMLQNHILQLLSLVAMEAPARFNADDIRDEKVKVMKAIRPFQNVSSPSTIIRGQYKEGTIRDKNVKGYLEESGIAPQSSTETFVAAKLFIDNARWEGVPFYIRAGKALKEKKTQIAVVFKQVPHSMFVENIKENPLEPNVLMFGIQPEQGIFHKFQAKAPGSKMCLHPLEMEFNYADVYGTEMSDDYETLLLDCMIGDQTLYWSAKGVEVSWELLTSVLEKWSRSDIKDKNNRLYFYEAGSWGPKEAFEFIERDNRQWMVK